MLTTDRHINKSAVPGFFTTAALNYLLGLSSQGNPFFGGFVNDDGAIKTAIAGRKAAAATAIENTGNTAALQALINAAVPGDVIEIQHAGPYGAITIPGGVSFTIRAGTGFLPIFTAANAMALLNGVTDVFILGLKYLNCTTADNNGKGSAILFNTNGYQCNGLYVSNCIFEKCAGSAVNLSYHMSIGGDNYASPYLLTELSSNVNFVDCYLLRACSDATEGAAILLRGMDGATIRRCYSDSGDGSDSWAGEGKTRSYMLQYAINSVIEDSIGLHAGHGGADEVFKFDQLTPGSSTFKNTVIVRRCYAEDAVQGFDNDDQGNINFIQNAAFNCNQGLTMQKATGEGSMLSNIVFNCDYGIYLGAAVPTGTLDLQFNLAFNSRLADYNLLNGFVLNTNNLEGSRPTILQKLLDDTLIVNTFTAGPITLGIKERNVICNSAVGFTVNLPTAIGIKGRKYVIKTINVGTIAVTPFGAETIDGGAVANLSTIYESITVISDGANWFII